MSSGSSKTRTAILEAAWKRLVKHGPDAMKLGQVARDAGVSRQAVYLHFDSRGAVLLALVDYIDEKLGLAALLDRPPSADPVEEVCEQLRVTARYAPKIHEVALAFQLNRHTDDDIAAAFENRMAQRRAGLRAALEAARARGRLVADSTIDEVVDALWAVGRPTFYHALVVDRGWSVDDYERFLVNMFMRMYVA